MKEIKFLLYFSLFFVVLYLGPVPIGPVTFSQLWKIPLLLYLLFKVFSIRKIKSSPLFVKFSYARAAKNLFNAGTLITPIAGIISFVRYMMFPLIYEFVSIKVKSLSKLNGIITILAQFVILSGIPFLLGLLESRGREIDLTQDFETFVGVFQTPHAASTTLAISLLILFISINKEGISLLYKSFNILLIFIGIYSLYFTFVRTGYAMFIIGVFILYLPKKITPKQILGSIILICALLFGFIYLLEHNEIFYNRIFDIRNGRETSAGSGRLIFWQGAFDLWKTGNFFELLFGHGMEELKDKMYQLVGSRIFAHNEFFTHLAVNGLIGLFILIGFLINLLKFIRKRKHLPSYRMALAIFFLYLSYLTTQGGMMFPMIIFMALIYVKLEIENEYITVNKDMNE